MKEKDIKGNKGNSVFIDFLRRRSRIDQKELSNAEKKRHKMVCFNPRNSPSGIVKIMSAEPNPSFFLSNL